MSSGLILLFLISLVVCISAENATTTTVAPVVRHGDLDGAEDSDRVKDLANLDDANDVDDANDDDDSDDGDSPQSQGDAAFHDHKHNAWSESEKDKYPNPSSVPEECNRDGDDMESKVCDADKVFTKETVDHLDELLDELLKTDSNCSEETCECGYTAKLAILDSVEGESKEEVVSSYAESLFKSWSVPPCGTLLVVAIDDKVAGYAVGEAASKYVITDEYHDWVENGFKNVNRENFVATLKEQHLNIKTGAYMSGSRSDKHMRYKIVLPIILLIGALIIAIIIAVILIIYRRNQTNVDSKKKKVPTATLR